MSLKNAAPGLYAATSKSSRMRVPGRSSRDSVEVARAAKHSALPTGQSSVAPTRGAARPKMSTSQPEKILDERKVGNRVEYLVKRHGTVEPAWEPRIGLMSATQVLKEWQKVKEARESKFEKDLAQVPPSPRKKATSPDEVKDGKRDAKRKTDEPLEASPVKSAKEENFAFTTPINSKPPSVKSESPAKAIPTNCVGILSILSPPTPATQKPVPLSPTKTAPRSPKKSDYVFVPPPNEKKKALTPSQREALKDREAVPFYSALDCSRGADDTNFGSASIESSQEAAGTTVPKAAQEKPQQQAPLLSWDDTLERNNLLRSNSAFPSTPSSVRFANPDDFLQKLSILLDNAPLSELSRQQLLAVQAKLSTTLQKVDRMTTGHNK